MIQSSSREMLGVGIIGCGAMGTTIATAIDNGTIPNVKLIAAFDQYVEKVEKLSRHLKSEFGIESSFEDFKKSKNINLVIEAASQDAVREYAVQILQMKKDFMIMSVGALLDSELFTRIETASNKYGRKVYLISGAVAGIDGIKAARNAGLDEVVLTTRKNPKSLAGSPYLRQKKINIGTVKKPRLIYEGPAVEAVKHFPANVNVAATLSLAGIGAEKTKVKVIADPNIRLNIHEVYITGHFGEMNVIMRNAPEPNNPKSSYIAALSAIETIRSIAVANIQLGT